MKLKAGIGEKPLWSQLYEILEGEILQGVYQTGDKLPSEKELMAKYEVSRVTVRQAMDKLMTAGLISRNRGIGTTVIQNDSSVSTCFQSSFHGVEEKNNVKDRRIIDVQMIVPPSEVLAYFELKRNTEVLKLTRFTYLENRPVTLYESYLNPVTGLNCTSDLSGSMYQKLAKCGYKIGAVKERITAAINTPEDNILFQKEGTFATLIRIRKGYCVDLPIEYTYSKYLAEGYNLEIDLK